MSGGVVVVFGDEFGGLVAVDALKDLARRVLLVYDPKKELSSRLFQDSRVEGVDAVLPHPDKTGRESFVREILAEEASLGLVASYSRILWRELLDSFPCGVVNFHGARLPQYRGANTLQWAIINGETETDATLHYIDEGIDTGPVIDKIVVPIGDDDTGMDVRNKLGAELKNILRRNLPFLMRGRMPAKPQNEELARYWPRRKPEDSLIDWSWSDEKIRNLTRALCPPWPPPFYHLPSGERVEIKKVLSLEEVRETRRRALAKC